MNVRIAPDLPDLDQRGEPCRKWLIARSMPTIRTWCDMDEVTRFYRFKSMPDTSWHDIRIARLQ